jgi:hypothetical protein
LEFSVNLRVSGVGNEKNSCCFSAEKVDTGNRRKNRKMMRMYGDGVLENSLE